MALFCCAFFSIKAQQNLILNGGFEDTLWCYPCGNFQITKFNNVFDNVNDVIIGYTLGSNMCDVYLILIIISTFPLFNLLVLLRLYWRTIYFYIFSLF